MNIEEKRCVVEEKVEESEQRTNKRENADDNDLKKQPTTVALGQTKRGKIQQQYNR